MHIGPGYQYGECYGSLQLETLLLLSAGRNFGLKFRQNGKGKFAPKMQEFGARSSF